MTEATLYERLGGYDAIAAVAGNLLTRLGGDAGLRRFWDHRGEDGIRREKQLLIDFLCDRAGGPLFYSGREMLQSHRGMNITDKDWASFIGHLEATLDHFQVPTAERHDVLTFVETTRNDIVGV